MRFRNRSTSRENVGSSNSSAESSMPMLVIDSYRTWVMSATTSAPVEHTHGESGRPPDQRSRQVQAPRTGGLSDQFPLRALSRPRWSRLRTPLPHLHETIIRTYVRSVKGNFTQAGRGERIPFVVTAIVLIEAERSAIAKLGPALADVPGVAEAYSVTGEFDFVAVLRVKNHEEIADVVTSRLSQVPGIVKTHTHVAFKVFSKHDLEAMFSVGLQEAR